MKLRRLPIARTRRHLRLRCPSVGALVLVLAMTALAFPTLAAIAPATGPRSIDSSARDIDHWRRIDFRTERPSVRKAAQIKVAIQTRGPTMQGLIRIAGAPASNFDTGKGITVVDLINVGDDARGYTDIVALEILFTQSMPGQFYQVFEVDFRHGAR